MPENANHASAGAPVHPEQHRPHPEAAAAARPGRPTPAQLDERERQKAGPRRPAGPPLEGGPAHPAAAAVHPVEPPPATDPKE